MNTNQLACELLAWLEIKRTSITRLKRAMIVKYLSTKSTWNQKNLDYEIETGIEG